MDSKAKRVLIYELLSKFGAYPQKHVISPNVIKEMESVTSADHLTLENLRNFSVAHTKALFHRQGIPFNTGTKDTIHR